MFIYFVYFFFNLVHSIRDNTSSLYSSLRPIHKLPNKTMNRSDPQGGHSTFFSGRGVRLGFRKCGACELTFASEKGGLVSRKVSKFGGL